MNGWAIEHYRLRKPRREGPRVGPILRRDPAEPSEQRWPVRRGKIESQMGECRGGCGAAAWRSLDEALLQKVRLIDILDRVLLLSDGNRQCGQADRTAVELRADRTQYLAIQTVQTALVHLQHL